MLGASELAKFFDHTLLSPIARESQIVELCSQAQMYGFFAVCVQPHWISRCRELLKNSDVKICTVVGFPLGQNTTPTKLFETRLALESGAQEIDMVINLSAFKDQHFQEVEAEITQIVKICGSIVTKVIIETAYLSPQEIKQATILCENAGASFVKTSTGFSSRGASLEDIQIMKEAITSSLKIKASGGIQNLETALKFIEAGVHRIGSSKSVQILEALAGDQK